MRKVRSEANKNMNCNIINKSLLDTFSKLLNLCKLKKLNIACGIRFQSPSVFIIQTYLVNSVKLNKTYTLLDNVIFILQKQLLTFNI